AYYWLRGYRDAAVDTALVRHDGTVEVDFTVTEGEPVLVDSLGFFGLEELNVPGVLSDLPLEVGDPLSAIRMEAVKDTLVSRLREVGYAHAAVFSGFFIPTGSRLADVTFDVDPGPLARFGPVRVEWLPGPDGEVDPELEEVTVRRMVPFREGGLYRFSQLVEGQRNLYNLEIIRTAQVQTVMDTLVLDTIIPIRIRVTEGDLHRVRAGAGWSTADCFNTEAQWASRNFGGGARRLTVRGRVSNILAPQLSQSVLCRQAGEGEFAKLTGQASVELVQPFVFSPRNSLTTNVFVERQSFPEVFVREALGATLALTRNLGRQATLTLSYQPALTRLEAGEVFFCISFLLCTDQDIDVFQSANWLSPVGLTVALNRSNRLLNPTAGYSLVLGLEHASEATFSDFSYNRAVAEATGYVGLGERTVLAARVRGGIVRPGTFDLPVSATRVSHPQKRFYSGGASSVRGFGENRLGPRVLSVAVERLLEVPQGGTAPACLPEQVFQSSCDASPVDPSRLAVRPTGGDALVEANLELRFPLLGDDLQGTVFLDVGQVWARDQDRQLSVDFSDLEATPGVGVRYFSPIGPIRVDVGYRSQGAEDLPILTSTIRPYDPGTDLLGDRLRVRGADGTNVTLDWVETQDLQRLATPVLFGGGDTFWRRLQFHFSIGQAF
ncbi:MAG TPA: BamA/TamA family outer membrane protein, partial [Longimicrobiales bacterium]|nr:BamA/TamA family outer membrane protein [Longimicrobiales bacterium]